jgi:hypothetical protein
MIKIRHLLPFILFGSAIAQDVVKPHEEIIRCGSLVYDQDQTAVCFAQQFLADAATDTGLNIAPNFMSVALATEEVFKTPLCIFTGKGNFTLTETERQNLRKYLENGGFIYSSPGCSEEAWNAAFKREIALALQGYKLEPIPMSHDVFSTVHKIKELTVRGNPTTLQGIVINGRLALLHSDEGLNDVKNAKGCCCCGGAEIDQARLVNINAVAYALLH